MEKIIVVLALINTQSGKHIVVHRKNEDNYGFPGGKLNKDERPINGLVRELVEETGLNFQPDDFEIINVQHRLEADRDITIHTFGCLHVVLDNIPLFSAENHIQPMLMDPSKFYQATKFKQYYENLFPQ